MLDELKHNTKDNTNNIIDNMVNHQWDINTCIQILQIEERTQFESKKKQKVKFWAGREGIFIFKFEFSDRLYSVETNQTVTSRVNLPRFRDYLLFTNRNRAFNLLRFT